MKSRVDVLAIDRKEEFSSVLKMILSSGYSRIPVYEEQFDNVLGILYIKDLIPHLDKGDDFDWQSLCRTPYFVPETKMINDLLKEFQVKKNHLAIVVDEYGGTSGIVTLEDVLEEIVGEINDEFDVDDNIYSKLDANNFIFEGKIFCPLTSVKILIFKLIFSIKFSWCSSCLSPLRCGIAEKICKSLQIREIDTISFVVL
jgi:CBS domain containing-hemolysin-like protein